MDNLNFLKQILTTQHEYWIVARKESRMEFSKLTRCEDSIWLISIPYTVRRGLRVEEIMLTDLETLNNIDLNNISLSEDYSPFQYGITMRNLYAGVPIADGKSPKDVLIKLLGLKSKSLGDYEKLLNSEQNPERSVATESNQGENAG